MAEDDYSKFRARLGSTPVAGSRPAPAPAVSLVVAGPRPREVYKAFATQDRQKDALELRRRIGTPSHAVSYHFLQNVAYDRGIWRRVCLTVSGLAIEIRGRDFALLADAV
jgi:hypothetical protein